MSISSAKILILLAITVGTCLATIENEPVKVTPKNRGPKYEVEEAERVKLANTNENLVIPTQQTQQQQQQLPAAPRESEPIEPSIGHVTIRRIFLVPSMPTWPGMQQPAERDSQSDETPSFLRLFPFMSPIASPAVNAHRHHLLGGDQASRSPFLERQSSKLKPLIAPTGEREETERALESAADGHQRPIMADPFQMMLDLMRNVLMQQANGEADLHKEASQQGAKPALENGNLTPSLEKSSAPSVTNETKEEIVELDGKKYLRKTVITKKISDDMFFITKRLIFVPLNETETVPATTQMLPAGAEVSTLATEAPRQSTQPSTTELALQQSSTTSAPAKVDVERQPEEATTTTGSTTSTTATSTSVKHEGSALTSTGLPLTE